MICACWRNARSSFAGSASTSLPSKWIVPPLAGIKRNNRRARVDLPEPDSPTSASVSPRRISSETSSTAETQLVARPKKSHAVGKRLVTPRSATRGSADIGSWVVAAELMGWLDPFEIGMRLHARLNAVRAAGREPAGCGHCPQFRHAPGDDVQRLFARFQVRHALEQPLRVRVARVRKDL